MSLAQQQYFLARLLVDPQLFREFLEDPHATSTAFGLSEDHASRMAKMRPQDLSRFREIVQGTRAARFREILPGLSERVGDHWTELLRVFHEEALVAEVRDDRDLDLFVAFIEKRYPASDWADQARLDRELYRLGALTKLRGPELPSPPGRLKRSRRAAVIKLSCPPRMLLAVRADGGDEISLFEIDEAHASSLELLSDEQEIAKLKLSPESLLELRQAGAVV